MLVFKYFLQYAFFREVTDMSVDLSVRTKTKSVLKSVFIMSCIYILIVPCIAFVSVKCHAQIQRCYRLTGLRSSSSIIMRDV